MNAGLFNPLEKSAILKAKQFIKKFLPNQSFTYVDVVMRGYASSVSHCHC